VRFSVAGSVLPETTSSADIGSAPARLEARGFGGNKPLVSPDQRGAAKINDRIEFIILERK